MAGSFEPKPDTEIIGRSGGMQVRAPRPEPGPEAAWEAPPAPAVPEGRRRGFQRLLVESAVVTAMTLACFAVFILFLSLSFPEGHGLRELLRTRDPSDGPAGPHVGREAAPPVSPIATLSVLHASVHSRSAGSIAWSAARSGLGLQAGDGIQTGAAGSAELNFEHGTVRIEKNSLVILGGGMDVGDLLARSPRALTFVRGELLARLEKDASGPMTVMLPRGMAKLHPVPASGPADFRITAGPDRSSSVTVLSGSLALESNGRVVNVGPRQYSRIGESGAPSDPLPVPGSPVVLAPENGARFSYLDLPPLVPFRWRSAAGRGEYRLRVTGAPRFRTEIVSQVTADSFLNWGRFAPGVYEWQVSRVVNGVEGVPSPSRRLVIEQPGGPVALTVEPLPKRVPGHWLQVRGKVRSGASVYVMGHPASVGPDGAFDLKIQLSPGVNVVLVEAVDGAGNSTYSSQVVYSEN
jgi:hypothetical protein